jgi:hypothetical protein
VARYAGRYDAPRETTVSKSATAPQVSGSSGLTSKRRLCIKLPAARETTKATTREVVLRAI